MDRELEEKIRNEFEGCVERTILRLAAEDTNRPFHRALLSEEALFWSRFERSFSTSFGQSVIERVSELAAIAGGADETERQRETEVELTIAQEKQINDHIDLIRRGKLGRSPNWVKDVTVAYDVDQGRANKVKGRVISDLWWRKGKDQHFMSIKTVKPNIDQTAEAKRDLLRIKASNAAHQVYFGLYYNPYGEERANYSWGPPRGVFDFQSDLVVLIGKDYWDTLGGEGFYAELLRIAVSSGEKTKEMVSKMMAKSL